MEFQKIVDDIKELKIQGAQNVAKAAVKAFQLVAFENKDKKIPEQMSKLNKAKKLLQEARPTEPALRNCLNLLSHDLQTKHDIYDTISKRAENIGNHFKEVEEKISKIGSKKIRNKSIIFTHCHSSTVINILKKAKELKKKFNVRNTETRPLFQGRITAKELLRADIPVTHYIDSAAKIALKDADMMLIGADAITSEGQVINKIGSELFALAASRYDIPVYVCTDSWKFDPLSIFGFEEPIEQRSIKEVWINKPDKINIDNHAFEIINPDLITGIISELGIYPPEIFVEEVRRAYPGIISSF